MLSCSLLSFSSITIRSALSSRVVDNPSLSEYKASIRLSRSSLRSVIIVISSLGEERDDDEKANDKIHLRVSRWVTCSVMLVFLWFTWSLIDCNSHVSDSSILELCKVKVRVFKLI